MALPCFMSVKGSKQGEIAGDSTYKGRENKIVALAVKHIISTPTDSHTGQNTGTRIHGPLKVTKPIDPATPLLYSALCTGEKADVILDFYEVDSKSGVEKLYYTTELKDARIIAIEQNLPHVKTENGLTAQEEISFSYEKITWTNKKKNTSATDSWNLN